MLPGAVFHWHHPLRHLMPNGLSLCACAGCRGTSGDVPQLRGAYAATYRILPLTLQLRLMTLLVSSC